MSVPLESTAGPWPKANADGLSFVTVNVTVWPLSFAGPGLMLVAHPITVTSPEQRLAVGSAPFVKPGGSFTELTVIVTVAAAEPSVPSLGW